MIKVPSTVPSKPLPSIACKRQIISADAAMKTATWASGWARAERTAGGTENADTLTAKRKDRGGPEDKR